MYEIKDNGLLLAIGGRLADIKNGRQFYGQNGDLLQWGTFGLVKGEVLQPHIHKERNRQGKCKTLEFFVVVEGKLLARYYSHTRRLVSIKEMKAGDFVCLYDGGHGFKALETNTKMIEVKLGPFIGVEEDKEKFNDTSL